MIILASSSPRRKELMKKITNDFKVIEPHINERLYNFNIKNYAIELAKLKARNVAKRYKNIPILAADTIVVYKNKIINKPKDNKDAIKILRLLSDKEHIVITGYSYIDKDLEINKSVKSIVRFNKLDDKLIKEYVFKGLSKGKAGAYGIQDGYPLIKSVKGSIDNVIGLPVEEIIEELKKIKLHQEIEIKALIKCDDYKKFINHFKKITYEQTNYYLDTKSFLLKNKKFSLRVREKFNKYQLTFKTHLNDGLLELNQDISLRDFNMIKDKGILPKGEINKKIKKIINNEKLNIITKLKTIRMDVNYKNGLLSVDKNFYGSIIDFEIEYEYSNYIEGKKILMDLFKSLKIKFKENKKSKVFRAYSLIH